MNACNHGVRISADGGITGRCTNCGDVSTINVWGRFDDRPRLHVMRLDPRAREPEYQTAGASGIDMRALDVVSAHAAEDGHRERYRLPRTLHVGEGILLGTGIAIALPPGREAQVRGRSSLAAKWGVLATLGTIDQDYRGEILVQLIAHCLPFTIQEGDRIAQLVVAPVTRVAVQAVEELDATERGSGGLGSTGAR